jgi:general nucleoside transport system ATP-binding protein
VVVLYRGRIMGTCRAHASERPRIGAWMAGQVEPARTAEVVA